MRKSMSISEYREAVIVLFKSGNATDDQWRQMAQAVLLLSEGECQETCAIDSVVLDCSDCDEEEGEDG